jgi:hypothetical protein
LPKVVYRAHARRHQPQHIRISVPGWAGDKQPRADGSHEQAWHCLPFSESARYGVELLYPFDVELSVTHDGQRVHLDADWGAPPEPDTMWPPFRPFGEDFYSYQLSLDLAVPPGWAIRSEPHPRYFTDPTNSTPLAVPALIRSEWWPMTYFCIFKAPPPGTTHVFRRGEPFISFIVIPADPDLTLEPMDADRAAQREMRGRRLAISRDALAAGTRWTSSTNTVFDGTYRNMARAARARAKAVETDGTD